MANPQNARSLGADPNRDKPRPLRVDSYEMPQLEATFVPGGYDDYYLPEVIAPSPQRVMPEVPQNMQDGLQRMELEARPAAGGAPSNLSSVSNANTLRQVPQAQGSDPYQPPRVFADRDTVYSATAAGAASAGEFKPFSQDSHEDMPAFDTPTFSPFPRVQGDNVPPSDEEKEEILYNARQHVLNSNNVSMQLVWARDSLSWVEIAAEAYVRENKGQAVRPATPRVEHELRIDAISIVDYLASQGHPEALFMRSKWLEFGRFGFRPDKKEAYLGYKKAAEQGWGRAEYRMGMLFEGSNDMEKALLHYNQGLALKDSAASYRMGMMSLLGQHGYRKDYQLGLELIQSAADTADEDAPQGAYVYGMLISRELPDITIPDGLLPLDLSLARQYIEKAAYLGFSKAQLNMGQAFELCQLGCDFNPALSLHYYGLAARQGQPEAALGVSRWFLFGYEGVFLKNEQLAYRYAQQAADAKLPTGEFAMGYYSEIGIHVQKDLHAARAWYEKAAEHGNKDAINRLSGLDQAKTLTKQDHETTALTRIKSKHGSQRGKRPERFSSRQHDMSSGLATLSENGPGISDDTAPRPGGTGGGVTIGNTPAFAINISQSNLVMRPKSAAPYPVDERPAPLNVSRPKSAAPYPDDEPAARQRLPMSAHYNPEIRQSSSLAPADRPLNAFGIRPVSVSNQWPLPASQSTGNLAPEQRPFSANTNVRPGSGGDPMRGRIASAGWEPQMPQGGYKRQSPGPINVASAGRGDHHASYDPGYGPPQQQQQQYQQPLQSPGLNRQSPSNLAPVGDPGRNRLSKSNPAANGGNQRLSQQPQGQGYGPGPGSAPGPGRRPSPGPAGAAGQPNREYGPRTSSRPVSSARPGSAGGPPPLQSPGLPQTPTSASTPAPSSTPGSRPQTAKTAPAKPGSAKGSASQGPATFEEMGIPQGKSDDDCVVM